MSKLITIIIASVSFFLGYMTSNFSNQTPAYVNPSILEQSAHPESSFITQLGAELGQVNTGNTMSLSQQNQNKILGMLNNLPESKVNNYLEQAFPEQDFQNIKNKKLFAERLIEEMNQDKDESNSLSGKIFISMNETMSEHSNQLNDIHPNQHIYAHFDTFGKVPPNTQVFVKWLNQETQEVVLFSPKYIIENSSQNWVSAVPPNGWKSGTYSVKFYQMTDSLTPIAQSSYTIQSILK